MLLPFIFSAPLIIEARCRKGWSQEVLAEHAGLSLRTIQRVEQGDTVPRGHTMNQLAHALGVPLESLRLPAPATLSDPTVPGSSLLIATDPAPPSLGYALTRMSWNCST